MVRSAVCSLADPLRGSTFELPRRPAYPFFSAVFRIGWPFARLASPSPFSCALTLRSGSPATFWLEGAQIDTSHLHQYRTI